LIRSKTDLPKLEIFEIKYRAEGFELRNKSPYWNFSRLIKEFELKFRKFESLLDSIRIYLKCLEISDFDETWSRCLSLHLVSSKIVPKRFVV
jgi:hypothetical protein